MGFSFRNFFNGIGLVPQNSISPSAKGDLRYNSSTDKVELYNGAIDPVVTEAKAATLTNKTMDGGSNTFTNLPTTSLSGTITIAQGGTGQTSKTAAFDALQPMTTGGDIIYGGASGSGTRLANGTSGQALTSGGGTNPPTWSSVLTNPMTTGGDIIYGGVSGAPTRLANGSAGQLLRSAGTTAAPTWSTTTTPDTIVSGRVPYATGTNTIGNSANLTFNGATLSTNTLSASAAIDANTAQLSVGVISCGFNGTSQFGQVIQNTDTGNTGNYIIFWNSSGTAQGSINQTNSTTTAFNTSSDYRLKENIIPIGDALNKVMQLKPSHYNFIENKCEMDGFVAHELQEIIPYAVTGKFNAIDSEGKAIYQSVDYSKLTPILTAAIQTLKTENDSLKADLAAIKSKLGI